MIQLTANKLTKYKKFMCCSFLALSFPHSVLACFNFFFMFVSYLVEFFDYTTLFLPCGSHTHSLSVLS